MTLKQRLGKWIQARRPCSRRLFETLRLEFRFLRQRIWNAALPWRRTRIARLRSMSGASLNVGSGGRGRARWINFDASPHHADLYCPFDIRRPLPFSNGAVKRILAEHIVEHLDYSDDIPRVFAEFHRVLEPGGAVRIIVPDAGRYLRAYAGGDAAAWRDLGLDPDRLPLGMRTPMDMINHVFHQGGEHLFGWDFETLEAALGRAGFSRVIRQRFGVSVDPGLALDQPNHAPYSLYVDAIR